MRRLWSTDELAERWSLEPGDEALLVGLPDAGKLGLVAQLSFWRCHGVFPDEEADLAPTVIAFLARETGVRPEVLDGYDWTATTGRGAPGDAIVGRSSTIWPSPPSIRAPRRICAPGFSMRRCRVSCPRPCWRRRSGHGSLAIVSCGRRPGVSTGSCVRHEPLMTRLSLIWSQGAWTPKHASGLTACSPTMAAGHRSRGCRATRVVSGWRA